MVAQRTALFTCEAEVCLKIGMNVHFNERGTKTGCVKTRKLLNQVIFSNRVRNFCFSSGQFLNKNSRKICCDAFIIHLGEITQDLVETRKMKIFNFRSKFWNITFWNSTVKMKSEITISSRRVF